MKPDFNDPSDANYKQTLFCGKPAADLSGTKGV